MEVLRTQRLPVKTRFHAQWDELWVPGIDPATEERYSTLAISVVFEVMNSPDADSNERRPMEEPSRLMILTRRVFENPKPKSADVKQ